MGAETTWASKKIDCSAEESLITVNAWGHFQGTIFFFDELGLQSVWPKSNKKQYVQSWTAGKTTCVWNLFWDTLYYPYALGEQLWGRSLAGKKPSVFERQTLRLWLLIKQLHLQTFHALPFQLHASFILWTNQIWPTNSSWTQWTLRKNVAVWAGISPKIILSTASIS